MMSTDMIAKLNAALDEDERIAVLQPPWPWTLNAEHDTVVAEDGEIVCEPFALSNRQLRNTALHIVRHDPARVLRQVAAIRKVLGLHEHLVEGNSSDRADIAERAGLWKSIKAFAEAYGIEP